MRKASVVTRMRIWTIAAVAALALGSFAAENVAPTKMELEEMYKKAFHEFDANNFPQALKELDAIDVRQPDLAASQNLRGVILMRQGIYDKAEVALLEAARIDPKFWNARFNLAEIPFLKKDWAEARKRFERLLSSSESDLASEASQLIQYKILLTYLLEGKENMVDSILAKLELLPDTPAVDYVKAAVALQHKNEKEAKDWMAVAEKKFSPQLNKLFAESIYEVGWLEKPAGQVRASLPLTTAAERSEKTKAVTRSKFEQAQQALRQRDFATAAKLVDEADQAEPNQPSTLNLRGEILMQQKQFDQAEAAFKRAAKLDPKFREAQYNLAQIPFKNKDYAKARERFETLFKQTPGGDKNQAAQLIKFKIYMTLLLEGKESRAQAIMEQFQFTGDTPALYYAQAAWEFKHNNPEKAADWTTSAKRIYSPALNSVFADAFYDVGWMQSTEIAAAPAPALETASVIASQPEGGPAIEPSPIPDTVVAANNRAEKSKDESLASSAPAANSPIPQMEATSPGATAEQPAVPASNQSVATGTSGKPAEAPAAPVSGSASTVESTAAATPAEAVSASPARQNEQPSLGQAQVSGAPAAATSPAAVLAPGRIAEGSPPRVGGIASRQTFLFGGLLLAGIFLLAWVVIPELRRYTFNIPNYWQARSGASARTFEPGIALAEKAIALSNDFFGGPRQVSLRLTASKPSLRSSALPSAKSSVAFGRLADLRRKGSEGSAYPEMEPNRELRPVAEPVFESAVGRVVEQATESSDIGIPHTPETETPAIAELSTVSAIPVEEPSAIPGIAEEAASPTLVEAAVDSNIEPIGQGQPVPYGTPVTAIQSSPVELVNESASDSPSDISTEPVFPQTTKPATMPETTQIPTAPVAKTPALAVTKPQPAGTTQTSVQLTFSFEIAAMQLTPTFKMGVLQVRPTSKIVSMRLAPSQEPQSSMNFQVSFEIAKIQPAGGALGRIRMTPAQQQKPTTAGSPSFGVAGLQLVPSVEATPVQLTTSQQGQAAVFVTVPFQIATIEFSPSLEIAAVVLNSNSKQVLVQLPNTGPIPGEGAPMFEIMNLQLNESGEIAMIQLNLLGQGTQPA
jgi:Flp pilus assembly protein TadD